MHPCNECGEPLMIESLCVDCLMTMLEEFESCLRVAKSEGKLMSDDDFERMVGWLRSL